ncbi:MAG: hypothetical protein NXY57DRAFT_966528 [Lentinula lateritia]|nr:MAG: hypothetical protein NXY57DRAFT_966528 [Lentinula lateritia]
MSCTTFHRPLPIETCDAILDCLPPRDIFALGKCSKTARFNVMHYKQRVFSVQYAYRNFFSIDEIAEFQKIQSSIALLVSGSTVLEFFNREVYNGDLDMYCHFRLCKPAAEWLIGRGYLFEPVEGQVSDFDNAFSEVYDKECTTTEVIVVPNDSDIRDYTFDTIAAVWNFIRGSSRIQLIATRGSPLETIFSFHSTCVMNIFTHRAAYCLFPKLTLEDKTTLLIDLQAPLNMRDMCPIRKYQDRGFSVVHRPTFEEACDPSSSISFLALRYVGDAHCCRIPFHDLGGNLSSVDIIESNSWDMAYTRKHNTIDFCSLSVPGAIVDYVIGPHNIALVRAQMSAVSTILDNGVLQGDVAMTAIQKLVRDSNYRPVKESLVWMEFRKLFDYVKINSLSISAPTGQDLIKLLLMIQRRYTGMTMDDPFTKTEEGVTKLIMSIRVGLLRTNVNRDALHALIHSFTSDNIHVTLHGQMQM